MSGVLLSVAFYAILRVKVDRRRRARPRVRPRAAARRGAGVARRRRRRCCIAQRDYKRMLAYSSIEHMGLLALGAAAGGPLATAAVLLHVLGPRPGQERAVPRRRADPAATGHQPHRRASAACSPAPPVLAGAFGLGVLALLGLPPFSLFASELGHRPCRRSPPGLGLGDGRRRWRWSW